MRRKTIGIIGVGHVGLPLLAALSNIGYNVIGLDIDREKIEYLKRELLVPIHELGLNETLKKSIKRVTFTSRYLYLMKKSDIIMVTICTPINELGNINLDNVNSSIEYIGKYLRKGQVIIFRSTVPPGTTRAVSKKLEVISGLKSGKDFFLAYCPERMIEGIALYEIYTLPKIIGGINQRSTEMVANIFENLGGRIMKVSSPEVAEICKFVDNLYRSLNIAFTNEIGMICEDIGIDAYEVVSTVNEVYERTHIFKPGLGAGGPCLLKDAKILKKYSSHRKIEMKLLESNILVNIEATRRVATKIYQFIESNNIQKPKIALLGLAFKGFPETDDIRGAPSIDIYNHLKFKIDKPKFSFFDPIVNSLYNQPVSDTLEECIEGANVVAFLTNHPRIMNIPVKALLSNTKRPLFLVDCWHNIVDLHSLDEEDVEIFRIGDGTL